jgi:hypothetical protein
MRPSKDQLLAALYEGGHRGRANGVTSAALAARLGTNERVVRELVTELRNDGVAVCGHPERLLHRRDEAEELEETCAFLRSRAMHSLVLESKLRRLPLADLVGQLRLKT